MTERGRKVLTDVDLIAAEDTREARRLLAHLAVSTPLCAYHDHNEAQASESLVEMLEAGRDIALISDAGTPLISDPGYRLIRAARDRDIAVVPVPGACAAITALCAAGLPSDRFLFVGFPPRTSSARRTLFESLRDEPGTLIFYESGKRIGATLADLQAVLGAGRRLVVARELTKRFETFLSGDSPTLSRRIEADPDQTRGELVLLVEGAGEGGDSHTAEAERVLRLLCEELPLGRAAALAARLTGAKKNALYRLGIELGLTGD